MDNKKYKIIFYKDNKGKSPVKEYMDSLNKTINTNKDSRIKLTKIIEYLDILSVKGFKAGYPYIKHIKGDIWELRPLRDRVFFFCWNGESFVLLSHFVKKTQETPESEKDKAEKIMKKFLKENREQ